MPRRIQSASKALEQLGGVCRTCAKRTCQDDAVKSVLLQQLLLGLYGLVVVARNVPGLELDTGLHDGWDTRGLLPELLRDVGLVD
eukprot:3239305-Amphidinium_carterae.1